MSGRASWLADHHDPARAQVLDGEPERGTAHAVDDDIEQLIADRKIYLADAKLSLPPLVRDLEIDYTALSLQVPQKVHFRYRLEDHDTDWQDPQ